jgi:abequosyltransferase
MPLLSICIPTFNRENYVNFTLDSILDQISEHTNEVEIIITDDGSKDNTGRVIKEYQNKAPGIIKYFYNTKNLGFDKNLINTVEKASGEYCIFVGDDDLLYPGAIKKIINTLKTNKNPFILTNYSRYNNDTEKVDIERMIKYKNSQFSNINEFFFTPTPNSKFTILGMNLIYISVIIFNRENWLKYANDYKKYIGINFIHSFIFLSILAKEKSNIVYIDEPLVKYRSNNARDWGTDIWQDYHLKLLKEAKRLNFDKSKISKQQIKFILKQLKSTYLGPIKKIFIK